MFNSIESICEEFGLPKGLSKSKLRVVLRKRIASIHADKTGGDFPNDAVKQLYLRMQEAAKSLDSQTKVNALERRDTAGGALELRIAALEASNYIKDSSYEESAQRAKDSAGRRYRKTMISSGVFAAICGAVLPFSQKITENPLFSPLVDVFWARTIIAVLFVLSGIGFTVMRIKELKLKRKVTALLSEEGMAWAVRKCVFRHEEEPDYVITQRKMAAIVGECSFSRWHKSRLIRQWRDEFDPMMPQDLAEKVAKLQISSLIERGVLHREGIRGVEHLYIVDTTRAREIIDDRDAELFEYKLF